MNSYTSSSFTSNKIFKRVYLVLFCMIMFSRIKTISASPLTTSPFYGIWCEAEKSESAAEQYAEQWRLRGFSSVSVFLTTDWSNLNTEPWYAVSVGIYGTEDEAQNSLYDILAYYGDAYVKYTGTYQGTGGSGVAQNSVISTNYDETVYRVQQTLNSLGYDCGTPDGIMGSNTQNAIIAYRRDHGLSVSDIIDEELLLLLGINDTDSVNDATDKDYKRLYYDFLQTGKNYDGETVDVSKFVKFSTAYINEDDIPEIIMFSEENSYDNYCCGVLSCYGGIVYYNDLNDGMAEGGRIFYQRSGNKMLYRCYNADVYFTDYVFVMESGLLTLKEWGTFNSPNGMINHMLNGKDYCWSYSPQQETLHSVSGEEYTDALNAVFNLSTATTTDNITSVYTKEEFIRTVLGISDSDAMSYASDGEGQTLTSNSIMGEDAVSYTPYSDFAEVIRDRENEYGTFTAITMEDTYENSGGGYPTAEGVYFIDLVDFDFNGKEELIIGYRRHDYERCLEVWENTEEGYLNKYDISGPMLKYGSDGGSICLYTYPDSIYIITSEEMNSLIAYGFDKNGVFTSLAEGDMFMNERYEIAGESFFDLGLGRNPVSKDEYFIYGLHDKDKEKLSETILETKTRLGMLE